jgi:hypothetical protein
MQQLKILGDPKETEHWDEKGFNVQMGENGFLTVTNHRAGEMSAVKATESILTRKEITIDA